MAGAVHFSTMDFKSGFWQVKMAPDLQQYTPFTVGNLGIYKVTHMSLWSLQCPSDFSASYAEYAGRVEPHILCHLSQ